MLLSKYYIKFNLLIDYMSYIYFKFLYFNVKFRNCDRENTHVIPGCRAYFFFSNRALYVNISCRSVFFHK